MKMHGPSYKKNIIDMFRASTRNCLSSGVLCKQRTAVHHRLYRVNDSTAVKMHCEILLSCQYSETNVMHFLFSLLRIKGLYMFRALLVHPQEALHKRHSICCVSVMSVGCNHMT
jgi:hypothetical protein